MFASSSIGQLTHNSSSKLYYIWILASGASHNMFPYSSCFTSLSRSSSVPIMIVDDTPMPLADVGSIP